MDRVGELHIIVEEAACWERKFMLFKVYLRQSVGVSSKPKPSKSVRPYWYKQREGFRTVTMIESLRPPEANRGFYFFHEQLRRFCRCTQRQGVRVK